MKLYKLTDQNCKTKNNTLWGHNVMHSASGSETKLCSDGVIHAYEDPRLAIIMNGVHANFSPAVLWLAEGDIVVSDGTKCGVKSLTTIKILEQPIISLNSKITFGIYASLEVYKEPSYVLWANNWLTNIDRSANVAYAANATANAAYVAYATYMAANAAAYAANAAYMAANAASYAANATANAAYVANAAYMAANAAAYAANESTGNLNFISLLDKAMEIK